MSATAVPAASPSKTSPLARRARGKMLERLARNEAWRDYLLIAGQEPVSEGLRCSYFRAKLATGERQQAWQGIGQGHDRGAGHVNWHRQSFLILPVRPGVGPWPCHGQG